MNLQKFHIPVVPALLVLIAFFLPWISISNADDPSTPYEYSGYQLADPVADVEQFLKSVEDDSSAPNPGNPMLLWIIPGVAVLSIFLVILTAMKPDNEKSTAIGHIVLALIGSALLIYALYSLVQLRDWVQPPSLGESNGEAQYGTWLTLIGLLGIAIGGILSLLSTRDQYAPISGGQTGMMMPVMPMEPTTPYIPPAPSATEMPATRLQGETMMSGATPVPATPPAPRTEVLNRKDLEALAWLVVKEGQREGHNFRLGENTSIGRSTSNDIILDDSAASGEHARIKFEDGKFFLYDLASTNGVFMWSQDGNEWKRIYREVLSDGQDLKIGKTVLHFMKVDRGSASA